MKTKASIKKQIKLVRCNNEFTIYSDSEIKRVVIDDKINQDKLMDFIRRYNEVNNNILKFNIDKIIANYVIVSKNEKAFKTIKNIEKEKTGWFQKLQNLLFGASITKKEKEIVKNEIIENKQKISDAPRQKRRGEF